MTTRIQQPSRRPATSSPATDHAQRTGGAAPTRGTSPPPASSEPTRTTRAADSFGRADPPPQVRARTDAPATGAPPADRGLAAETDARRTQAAVGGDTSVPVHAHDGSGGGRLGVAPSVRAGVAAASRRTEGGPIPAEDWAHPDRIASRLTQTPPEGARVDSTTAAERCGPANVLAASVMNGPEATARTIRGASASPRLSTDERRRMGEIADHVQARTATMEELSEAQGLMYRAGNTREAASDAIRQHFERHDFGSGPGAPAAQRTVGTLLGRLERDPNSVTQADMDRARGVLRQEGMTGSFERVPDPQRPDHHTWVYRPGERADGSRVEHSGFDDEELRSLASRSTGSAHVRPMADVMGDEGQPFSALLRDPPQGLAPGQAATTRVHIAPPDSSAPAYPDHFITVGRQPDGTPYLYNPDPAPGDATLTTGDAAVRRELQRYEGGSRHRSRVLADGDRDYPNVIITRPGG